ncbi:ElaA protein [Lewinella aquimaris]|uniref:ElaA protein n=1 Tax=Neolewinella aquimaris TaxID=1835722 RepID=A0A840E0Z4_9BACT|nr:GNAT family N-acetyltransferase [Neolewinella aquimaris]MBB4079204.1 ElaA protein [Neolewinella aquimaris]
MQPEWNAYRFEELSNDLLYEILAVRQEVFVVEQTCYYLDADGKDQEAWHVVGTVDGRVAAYTRVLDRGVSYADYASIGRVLTAPFARGAGLGRPLMEYSRQVLVRAFGEREIKISAQAHLQNFYASLGYVGIGDVYDEDGIPHRAMLYDPAYHASIFHL